MELKAIATYEQVLKIDPKNAEASSGKGLVYLGEKQYQKADASFQQALKEFGDS